MYAFYDSVVNIFNTVRDFLIGLWDSIVETISDAFSAVGNFFSGMWIGIQNIFASVGSWFGNIFDNAWTNITNAFSSVGGFFTRIWNSIKSAFSSVGTWFKDTFKKAWEGVKNVFSTGGKIFSGIKEGISDVFKNTVNTIIDGLNIVISAPFNTQLTMLSVGLRILKLLVGVRFPAYLKSAFRRFRSLPRVRLFLQTTANLRQSSAITSVKRKLFRRCRQ
jgi:phage-related protein